jgi:hypothetical protein
MLMRPHDRRIDGMFLVGGRAKARPDLESGIPHPELAPPREAHEGRVPISVSAWHVAPRRAGSQHPQNAINRPPLVLLSAGRARHDRGEVDRKCAIPSLSDRSDSRLPPSFTYEKTVNTT